jgi:hypothetical protein
LTKKIHSHPRYLVRIPPNRTPAAAPLPPIAPQIPSALFRSAPSSKVVVMIDSVDGETIAAPSPCTARAATSTPVDAESPHTRDAIEKSVRPARNIRLRPRMSPARPPSRRKPPNVIAYAVITHWRPVSEKWRLRPIEGSATLTIDTSSTVMKKATQTSASACQRLGSGPVAFIESSSLLLRPS